jgi:hypothetical protein
VVSARIAKKLTDLRERFSAASPVEQEQLSNSLLPELRADRALKKVIRSWSRRGFFLGVEFLRALESALVREDLSPTEKQRACEEADEFIKLIHRFREDTAGPISPELALHLSMIALWAGLRAGISVPDLRKMEKERQRRAGKKSGEKRRSQRPWVDQATTLAEECSTKYPRYSKNKVALYIRENWKQGAPPDLSTLTRHLTDLEAKGRVSFASRRGRA